MSAAAAKSSPRYEALARTLLRDPRVELSERRGFGSSGLWTAGKLFAFSSSKGDLVVKLPRDRVDALVEGGVGTRFDPGHGRVMKEWLAVTPTFSRRWPALAREALEFGTSSARARGASTRPRRR